MKWVKTKGKKEWSCEIKDTKIFIVKKNYEEVYKLYLGNPSLGLCMGKDLFKENLEELAKNLI